VNGLVTTSSRAHGDEDRVGPVRAADGILGLRQAGDLALERRDRRAEDEGLIVDHLQQMLHHLVTDGDVLGLEIKKWNSHGRDVSRWDGTGRTTCGASS
jgi:hypothetical protein